MSLHDFKDQREKLGPQIEYVLSLPDEISESLTWYTGGGFDQFNTEIRQGKVLTGIHKKHFDNIELAFQAVPPLEQPYTVYKGIDTDQVYSTDLAYSSTSSTLDGVRDFVNGSCCILQITIPAGARVIPLTGISNYEDETEVLLDRGAGYIQTSFRFEGYDRDRVKVLYITYVPRYSAPMVTEMKNIEDRKENDIEGIKEMVIKYLIGVYEEEDEDLRDMFEPDIEIATVLSAHPEISFKDDHEREMFIKAVLLRFEQEVNRDEED